MFSPPSSPAVETVSFFQRQPSYTMGSRNSLDAKGATPGPSDYKTNAAGIGSAQRG